MKTNFWKRLKVAGKFLFNYGGTGSGYAAATNTRYRGRRSYSDVQPEEAELDAGDRQRIVSTLLDFRRNNSLVKSLCRLRETDVVGNGITPRPSTGDEILDEQLWERWNEFSMAPEVTQTMTMRQVQQQLASMTLIFGDGGLLLTRNGQVQMVEGDRIGSEESNFPFNPRAANTNGTTDMDRRNPIIDGVEVSRLGKPVAYHIGERFEAGGITNLRRVRASDFIFVKKFMRPTQVRGVPELATVVNDLQDVDEYDSIEMVAAKVGATLSAVVKRQGSLDYELAATAAGQDQERQLENFNPGQFHYLEPDEDISVISAGGRPNTDAIKYLEYRLRKIGSTIGIPVEFMLMTIGRTSFSASQGMVLLYQQTVENEQRALMQPMSRLWRWKVANWLRDPELNLVVPDGADPFRVSWQPPSFRWINRAAQVKADTAYLQMGALSLDDISSTFGYDATESLEKKAKNIRTAKRLAAEYDVGDWRELFNPLTTFGNVNLLDLMNAENGDTSDA